MWSILCSLTGALLVASVILADDQVSRAATPNLCAVNLTLSDLWQGFKWGGCRLLNDEQAARALTPNSLSELRYEGRTLTCIEGFSRHVTSGMKSIGSEIFAFNTVANSRVTYFRLINGMIPSGQTDSPQYKKIAPLAPVGQERTYFESRDNQIGRSTTYIAVIFRRGDLIVQMVISGVTKTFSDGQLANLAHLVDSRILAAHI